jgi:hypothetical protein
MIKDNRDLLLLVNSPHPGAWDGMRTRLSSSPCWSSRLFLGSSDPIGLCSDFSLHPPCVGDVTGVCVARAVHSWIPYFKEPQAGQSPQSPVVPVEDYIITDDEHVGCMY